MVTHRKRRAVLATATILAGLSGATSGWAQGSLTSPRVPPDPSAAEVEENVPDLGNVLNKPITGAQVDPLVVGTPPPPSLEALQAIRPARPPCAP
jgi:defect-in-organelle-trafficking protein DotC